MRRPCDKVEKYQKLKLKETLNRSSHYAIACRELALITRNAYSPSPKTLQARIFQDALLAFRLLPLMQTQSAASAATLVLQSVEVVFPKQRKVAAATEFRHAIIAHKKALKSQYDDHHLGATQVPQDVLVLIFSFLDVWSLISAAAVCRLWNDAAIENHLWESLYSDFFDDCSPHVEVNHLNIDGGANHNADVKIKEYVVTQTKTNWRDAFKSSYKAKKFNSHRGYCRHCNSLVWLSDTKFSNKSSGDNCKHPKVKPVSSEQILDFLLNDQFTTYSSDSDSDDDNDNDDKFLLKLWAYPSQMLPSIGSD